MAGPLRLIAYRRLQDGVADCSKLDRDAVSVREFVKIRDALSRRLEEAYEYDHWPFLKEIQKRYYRADWDSASVAYVVGDERWYPDDQGYYQCIRAHTSAVGKEPTNLLYWAPVAESYAADYYDAAVTYSQGDQVLYRGRFYQYHNASPAAGNLPTDVVYWGALQTFDRYVAYEQAGEDALGDVWEVWDDDPRLNHRAGSVGYALSKSGVQIVRNLDYVWIEFRELAPPLTGLNFDSTAVYTGGVDQVYFSSASVPGDFYNTVTTTSAGESPATAAAKWAKVEIYQHFEQFLVKATAADVLQTQDEGDDAAIEDDLAEQYLGNKGFKLRQQQGQHQRAKVLVRS